MKKKKNNALFYSFLRNFQIFYEALRTQFLQNHRCFVCPTTIPINNHLYSVLRTHFLENFT